MTIAELHEVVLHSAADHDLPLTKRQAYQLARDISRHLAWRAEFSAAMTALRRDR